ncbi:MAG: hypothetical protein Q8J89_12475 [Caulobacter sp.]|nr:hypothetical protein [Caulobacter sp.]
MTKAPKPTMYEEWVAQRLPGVEDRPVVWRGPDDEAETLAALEEYRRTGISHDAEEVFREFRENVRKRSARKR